MRITIKAFLFISLSIVLFTYTDGLAQDKKKKKGTSKREAERHATRSRDSLLRTINKADTSINSLLQRVEQYTTTYNQISNTLSEGLDTADISQQLPPVVKRINKINSLASTHKSSTLRYLFVLRDNLDHMQTQLDSWQSDLEDVNTKLIQNQTDLLKFTRDSLLKTVPADSLVRKTFFTQRKAVYLLWRSTDSTNRNALLKVNLLQDKIAMSYTEILDEGDKIDSKIKGFVVKAVSGEADYIWIDDPRYDDFKSALDSTIRLNQILFNYFIKNETATHLVGLLFFVLVFSWIFYNRAKAIRNTGDDITPVTNEANYIYKKPVFSALLLVMAIIPYFYNHPPAVFLETFFLVSIILSLILIKKEFPKSTYFFLVLLFVLAVIYCISNLFIQISNIDRYVIFLLSLISIITSLAFLKRIKQSPEGQLAYTATALKFFIGLQVLSMLLNITGRFSLSKILSVTAVFNLWLLLILYLVVNIIIEGLFLQFQIKKGGNSFINWLDYNLVKQKLKKTLVVGAFLLWLFFLLQNLSIDDWASDYVGDILNESRTVGGASFTFGGFVIFIFVIWLSSVASRIISYFYDVSAQRVTDLSVFKKKNRTSVLIIRMGVFSIGFLLAVAASNFPLEKLTIIISAFGVGIGFGLQNIVNNLVSGLILAFEKPIQIGDVIQVDGHTGTMKQIGIRSSTVVTGDGSEVIIPNGDLISHQVVNWTLSNSNRRIDLSIITAYGVDIAKTKNIMKNLLLNREDVMATPAPTIYLNNVSENAVEFKVFFWEADISTTSELKSKILSEIHEALAKENIQLPSTQKDIYLYFPEGVPLANLDKAAVDDKSKKKENKGTKENPSDQGQ